MKIYQLFQTTLASVLCWCSVVVSHAGEFEPADYVLDDHAALIPVMEGIRRVRVSYRDEAGQWQVYSLAHLEGNEGQIKLRLPDGVSLAEVRIEVSDTDPFPYEVYAGRSDFVTEVDGTVSTAFTLTDSMRASSSALEETTDAAGPVVQESDLWKWDGETLYFYNQLRGLQIFDFSDPVNPVRTHSLRMPALGEDMYLHPDGEHLILLAKRWSWGSDSIGSEAVVVRLSGDGLAISNRIPLPGNGVVESRMVGSHLYIAMRNSRRIESPGEDGRLLVQWESGLTVEHIDLSDSDNPVVAEPLNLFSANGWWYQAVVSATPDYFIVAPYVYDGESREYKSTIHLIDIRDQNAPLEITASAELDGQLKDKFKLRIKDNILTCVTQGGRWRSGLKTVVANYDLNNRTYEGEIRRLDELTLAPQETLFATRFDGNRLYVVTAIQIDPLFVVDLSDDNDLRLLGELKIPGWSHYLQPRGERLLSVGVEDRRVAISQFDVSDPANMGPPQRVYLGEEGEYSWSEGNYDEQAVGYFPDRGVMIVPFQTYGRDWNSSETALQILTFTDDSLEKAGVIKTNFVARRATLLDDTLVSVSGREVNALDVSELSDPQPLSSMEVAWPVERVFSYGDYVLQIEGANQGLYWGGQNTQGAVLRISSDDDLDTVLARVELAGGNIVGMELRDNFLHVLTSQYEEFESEEGLVNWRQVAYHQVVDLTDPVVPTIGKPCRFEKATLHTRYQGRQLASGRVAWIPEIQDNPYWMWGLRSIDIGFRGGWGYSPNTSAQILVVDVSDPTTPILLQDYRIDVDTDGPANDGEEVKLDWASTISGIVEQGQKIFLSFREETLVTDEEGEGSHYQSEHKLRVATISNDGSISVTPAVGVPGTVKGVRNAGDDGGWLLLSTAQATSAGDDERVRWSSDLVLQTSVFDGLTTFLIDELIIPNAYYQSIQITGRHFAIPSSNWDGSEASQSVDFYPFDLMGEIGEPKMLELEFYPNGLVYKEGILSTTGWGYGQQVWWMFNPDAIDDPEPAVVETVNQFYVDLNHSFFDTERSLAWVPVGDYGVETIDLAPLFDRAAAPGALRFARSKVGTTPWVNYQISLGHLSPAGGDDNLGALAADEIWRYRPAEIVTYADWIARQLGEDGNPEFVVPSEDDDLDGDALSNWSEFALGTNPTRPDSSRVQIRHRVTEGQVEVGFDLPRGHKGVAWEVQTSHDLAQWATSTMTEMSAQTVDENITRMRLRFPVETSQRAAFWRLNFKR